VVSSIQERCRLAESLDDLKVMGEAKQGIFEVGTRFAFVVLKHLTHLLPRLVVETSAAAAEIESKALLSTPAPPNQLVCNMSAADLLSTISSFGTIGKPGI